MSHDDSGESSFAAVIKAEFNELMTAMKGIQSSRETMKMELSAEQEAADRLVKRMRLTKGVGFKRKGNEKQLVFNEGIRDKIESVTKPLSATPPAVEKATE